MGGCKKHPPIFMKSVYWQIILSDSDFCKLCGDVRSGTGHFILHNG